MDNDNSRNYWFGERVEYWLASIVSILMFVYIYIDRWDADLWLIVGLFLISLSQLGIGIYNDMKTVKTDYNN